MTNDPKPTLTNASEGSCGCGPACRCGPNCQCNSERRCNAACTCA